MHSQQAASSNIHAVDIYCDNEAFENALRNFETFDERSIADRWRLPDETNSRRE